MGIEGSQKKLNDTLMKHGDKEMAEDFLNSGSAELDAGGRAWGNDHGYYIDNGPGSNRVSWGAILNLV